MPGLDVWETFFRPESILGALGFTAENEHVVEFGCGYGTFTIPAALILASRTRQLHRGQPTVVPPNPTRPHKVAGKLVAFDIDPEMIAATQNRARLSNIDNVEALAIDFDQARTPLNSESVDYAMLFNILHGENPLALLLEAHRLLKPGAAGGLIHWNYDPDTPRGPPMEIRPKPAELAKLTGSAGFLVGPMIDLPPHHYGFRFEKPALG